MKPIKQGCISSTIDLHIIYMDIMIGEKLSSIKLANMELVYW